MTESGFTVDVDQNQYLPEGGREVSAVVARACLVAQSTRINPRVGDEETATAKLGRAVAVRARK